MKTFIGIVIALAVFEVEGRDISSLSPASPSSPPIPDFLVDTIAQSVICRRRVYIKPKNNEQFNITLLLTEDDPAFNEYFGCIWQMKQIIDTDGKISEEVLRQYFTELITLGEPATDIQKRLVETIMEKCKDVQGENYGDRSVKVHNCALRTLHEAVKTADKTPRTN